MWDWGSSDRGLELAVRKPHGGGMTMQMETNTPRAEELVALAASFAPVLREHAAAHDRDGTWVAEPFEALRAGRPADARRAERAGRDGRVDRRDRRRRPRARQALRLDRPRLSMHHHVTAFTAWRWRRGLPGAEATLKRVAGGETVLVSTGGGDFTHPQGHRRQGRRRLEGQRAQAVRQPVARRRRDVDDVHLRRSRAGPPRPQPGRAVRRGRADRRELGHPRHARHGEQRHRGRRRLRARRQDPRRPPARRRRPAAAGDLQHRLPDHRRRLPGRRRGRRRGCHRVGPAACPRPDRAAPGRPACATGCASPAGRSTVRSPPSATTRRRRWRRSPR